MRGTAPSFAASRSAIDSDTNDDYVDEYKAWKKSGPNAAEMIGEKRLAQVGVQFFERAMLPELVKRPVGLDPKPPETGK